MLKTTAWSADVKSLGIRANENKSHQDAGEYGRDGLWKYHKFVNCYKFS